MTLAVATATITPVVAQTQAEQHAFDQARRRYSSELHVYQMMKDRMDGPARDHFKQRMDTETRNFEAAKHIYEAAQRRDSGNGTEDAGWPYDQSLRFDYDAVKDFREGPQYRRRTLKDHDQVFRGGDGHFYCKRKDGSTGRVTGMEGVPTGRDDGRLGVPMGAAVDNFMHLWQGPRSNAPVICH